MNDISVLTPILGVAVGWILSQISSSATARREDKRIRRSAIPAMVELYFQQYRINSILNYFNKKLSESIRGLVEIFDENNVPPHQQKEYMQKLFSGFESTRQGNLDLPTKNKENIFSSIDDATKNLSKVDPLKAYRLSRLANEFNLLMEIKLPKENLSTKEYLDTWSALLATFHDDIQSLRKLILRTSFNVGFLEFANFLLLIRQEEKNLASPPVETLESLHNIVERKLPREKSPLNSETEEHFESTTAANA